MATVCNPSSGRVTASFDGVAKPYGVSVAICPPRRGKRKGVAEKVNHTAAQRWWRTLTAAQAQVSVDRFARGRSAPPEQINWTAPGARISRISAVPRVKRTSTKISTGTTCHQM